MTWQATATAATEAPDRRRVIPAIRRFLTAWTVAFTVAIALALAGVIDPYAAAFGIGPYVYVAVRSLVEWSFDWMHEPVR